MNLEIKVKKFSTITLVGKCTIYSVSKLTNSLLEILQSDENILVDLEEVREFDTAGLQLFISAKNTAKRLDKKIKFTSHPLCVIALLDLYGLTSFFGDKIVLTSEEKKQFSFKYGIRKKNSFTNKTS